MTPDLFLLRIDEYFLEKFPPDYQYILICKLHDYNIIRIIGNMSNMEIVNILKIIQETENIDISTIFTENHLINEFTNNINYTILYIGIMSYINMIGISLNMTDEGFKNLIEECLISVNKNPESVTMKDVFKKIVESN